MITKHFKNFKFLFVFLKSANITFKYKKNRQKPQAEQFLKNCNFEHPRQIIFQTKKPNQNLVQPFVNYDPTDRHTDPHVKLIFHTLRKMRADIGA